MKKCKFNKTDIIYETKIYLSFKLIFKVSENSTRLAVLVTASKRVVYEFFF